MSGFLRADRVPGRTGGRLGLGIALPRIALPILGWASIAALAFHPTNPLWAAEDRYLASVAAVVLAAACALAPAPGAELGWGSVAAAALAWSLPPGPGRGAAVLVALTTVLAITAARRLTARPSAPLRGLPLTLSVPLALGAQFLLRGELLFPPLATAHPLRTAVALAGLPLLAGLAAALLGATRGTKAALVAGAAALLLGPGWNVASTLALLALAAGALAATLRKGDCVAAQGSLAEDLLGYPLAIGTSRQWLERLAAVWWLPLLVLAAPILWEPRAGFVAAACGLALALAPRARGILAGLVLLGAFAAPLWWHAGVFPGGHLLASASTASAALAPLASLCWLLLVLPAVVRPARFSLAFTAALLALATPWVPDRAALAAPIALAALSLPSEGGVLTLQLGWFSLLTVGTSLMAAYPWLRPDPLAAALGWTGLEPSWLLALVLALGLGLAAIASTLARRTALRRASRVLGWAAVAAAIVVVLSVSPRSRRDLLEEVKPLSEEQGQWHSALPPTITTRLVIDSALTHAEQITAGTVVAEVHIQQRGSGQIAWALRAGEETGEWSARRPDVLRTATLVSPAPWCSWVDAGFFAQRYRAVWTLPSAMTIESVTIVRAPALAHDVNLALYQVAVER